MTFIANFINCMGAHARGTGLVSGCYGDQQVHFSGNITDTTGPAQSGRNLKTWVNNLFTRNGGEVMLDAVTGQQYDGVYHHLLPGHADRVESTLMQYITWATQCQAAGVSAGSFFKISPSGVGYITITHKIIGPFV